ncbi:MAG: hypothetical protein HC773_19495 [Scytonema sp. CRU_2_7]|nr:hypothetical protein [Scytonema sp. CRU_2_7]
MNIDEDFAVLIRELRKLSDKKFTGKLSVVISMKDGGIAQMSLNTELNLKKL